MPDFKISVIMPCHNGERFLRSAVESVLRQSYDNFEIIFINDGSTDATEKIVCSFSDSRLKYFYQNKRGVSRARNYGIKLSNGEFIALLDSDDLWSVEKLELLVKRINRGKETYFLHSSYYVINEKDDIIGKIKLTQTSDILRRLLLEGNIIGPPSGVLVKREVFESVGGFDPLLSTAADWDMWIRIASRYPVGYIDEPLFKYRKHSSNMHYDIETQERDSRKILHKSFDNYFLKGEYSKIRSLAFSNLYTMLAKCYLKKRRVPDSIRMIGRSLYYCPLSFFKLARDSFKFLIRSNKR